MRRTRHALALENVRQITRNGTAVDTDYKRMATWPSALVLSELLVHHGGNPPSDVLERAGFSRDAVTSYLQGRSDPKARCTDCPAG